MTAVDTKGGIRDVPVLNEVRREIWHEALALMRDVSRREPLPRIALGERATRLLQTVGLGENHLGWAMVMLNNAFWLDQFCATPIERRLLFLPRCLATLGDVEARARALGYRTIVAEGTPVVVKLLAEQDMDAVLGVGCLQSLEKAFDKVSQLGLPAVAIPLTSNGCAATTVDANFFNWFLEATGAAPAERTRSYLPLLREACNLFADAACRDLLADIVDFDDPTARIGYDWLRQGGKRLRPFVTLAAYQSLAETNELPRAVRQVAVGIEAFHKASLVHDDIEDNDPLRYGEETLHLRYGNAIALNVGDWLIGLGYRLAMGGGEVSAQTAAEMGRIFSEAHLRLAEGQGAELLWSRQRPGELTLAQILKWYVLKTSPAFEAALAGGLALVGQSHAHAQRVKDFCKSVGAAFQVLNDLDGWVIDGSKARPTALLALALERCDFDEREILLTGADEKTVRKIYQKADVFSRAQRLVARLRERALNCAEDAPPRLADLLRFLVEVIVS